MKTPIRIVLIMLITASLFPRDKHLKLDMEISEAGEVLFESIIDIATDSKNNIYALDRKQKTLYKFAEDGSFLKRIGRQGQGPGEFQSPCSVYIGPDDLIYVLDETNRRIEIFKENCDYLRTIILIEFPIGNAKKLAVDKKNNVFISGYFPFNDSILAKYSSKGELIKTYRLPIIEYSGISFDAHGKRMLNQFLAGGSLCIDHSERIYVSYSWPYIIKSIDQQGEQILAIDTKSDAWWTPFIFETTEINGILFSESTRTIKVFFWGNDYLVNSIYVKDWTGNPRKKIDRSLLRKDPEIYYKINGEYSVLDIYSKDGKFIDRIKSKERNYFFCSDGKQRILGVERDNDDMTKIVRYSIEE